MSGGRVFDSSLCSRAEDQARNCCSARRSFRSPTLGGRSASGLVRSVGRYRGRETEGLCVLHAQHGQWRSLPLQRFRTAASKRFWRRTSGRLPISGEYSRLCRYDNLKSAVKKILRGHQREETTRFIAFRSHWGFQSEFCTPGEGHEKGGVEGEGGYFRRNHMVPVPRGSQLGGLGPALAGRIQAGRAA